MKLRQARKIMKNVRLYRGMIWVYGVDRVNKANDRMLRYHSAGDENIKRLMQLVEIDPLAVVRALMSNAPKATGIV